MDSLLKVVLMQSWSSGLITVIVSGKMPKLSLETRTQVFPLSVEWPSRPYSCSFFTHSCESCILSMSTAFTRWVESSHTQASLQFGC